MTIQNVKRLAQLTIAEGKIDKKLANIVLAKLSRKELIEYARRLKALADKNTVRIQSQNPLPESLKKVLGNKFEGKEIIFEIAQTGDGIRIINNDTIIDLTIKGLIDQTVNGLKESL